MNRNLSQGNCRTHRKLAVEGLERREMMAPFVGFNPSGTIIILGTNLSDHVQVDCIQEGAWYAVKDCSTGATIKDIKAYNVKSIWFQGGRGDDVFINHTKLTCSAYGEEGADTLVGGPGEDKLVGGEGDDTLEAGMILDVCYRDALFGDYDCLIDSAYHCSSNGPPGHDTFVIPKGFPTSKLRDYNAAQDTIRYYSALGSDLIRPIRPTSWSLPTNWSRL